MKNISKERIIAILATVLIHALLFWLLYELVITKPEKQEENSSVILGEFEDVFGEDFEITEVDVAEDASAVSQPEAAVSETVPEPEPARVEPLVTADEESVPTPKVEENKAKEEELRKAKEEADRKAKEEADRKAKEEADRKAKEEADNKAKKAFGNKGSGASANIGSPDGNSSVGVVANVSGRSHTYLATPGKKQVNDEGVIVVNVTVEADGTIKNAVVNNSKTTISNNELRNDAVNAAKKSTFNVIQGVDKAEGTITYRYKLN